MFGGRESIEDIEGSDYLFITETIQNALPDLPVNSERELCKYLTDTLSYRLNWRGQKPEILYHRGFVSIKPGLRIDNKKLEAIGLPLFSKEIRMILGLKEDDSDFKTFLKTAKTNDLFTAPNVANVNLDVFFNEINFNAVKSIVPQNKDMRVLRYIPNTPQTPKSVYFHFNPPIWCPVEPDKFKTLIVNIKDNEGNDVTFKGGESIFQICFRKQHG